MNTGKDLTKVAPRSPSERLGGYAILARTIDKGRALLWGNIGDYHFDCPLDNFLFSWKGITGDDLKREIEAGKSDEELVAWVNENGTQKTREEIEGWSKGVEDARPYDNPEKRDWFVEQCTPLGLDPAQTTLFQWLDVDDKVSFGS